MIGKEVRYELDGSQLRFCKTRAENVRLLAPAGCGKTSCLLHRCLELVNMSERAPRFLIVTFTRTAASELESRIQSDQQFETIRGQVNVTTLNAWGWSRIRNSNSLTSPKLLTKPNELYFAVKNQLHPVWSKNDHISPVVTKPGNGARVVMTVMDNLKSMGFVHTRHTDRNGFMEHLSDLTQQGLAWRIGEQFELLMKHRVLDSLNINDPKSADRMVQQFYSRFYTFWKKAVERLIQESTFTFEDQKYWNYLDLLKRSSDNMTRPTGVARYDHIMVDEFQDINPLDLALVKELASWHRATLTIVGDDDQAIFEWRGATPEYILRPELYLGKSFVDYQLEVNYRSPKNIVEHSQNLIRYNINRVTKNVAAAPNNIESAKIEIKRTDSIHQRLKLVTQIVRSTKNPGRVAVISRLRRQLIPYQIYYASDGAPFKTAVDLDVFSSEAFDRLVGLLEIWERSNQSQRLSYVNKDVIEICNVIRRRPLGKKDKTNILRYLSNTSSRNTLQAVESFKNYDGPKLSGKTHVQLFELAKEFLGSRDIAQTLRHIGETFDGLQFDKERAEEDVFFTAPPLDQLADICEIEEFSAWDLIDNIERVKVQVQEYRDMEDIIDNGRKEPGVLERPLHLMTATRAKGKEFETVILLDAVQGVWPHKRTSDQREIEAERRLFYVAFTRARHRVVILTSQEEGATSQFVKELGLKGEIANSLF